MDKKIKGVKLYEQAVEKIKDAIIRGEYVKGDLLPSENDLVQSMGVSRITIREALRILAEVGIIEKKKGKGSFVLLDAKDLILDPEINQKHREYRKAFENSTDTRIMLEPEIARQVALNATEDDILKLEECLNRNPVSKQESQNITDIEKFKEGFHWCLIEILDNQIVTDLFEKLSKLEEMQEPSILIPPGKQGTIAEEFKDQHKKIFEAIKAHNAEFAYFYMKEHALHVKEIYKNYFDTFFEE